jgi:hypothetical protein
VPAQCGQERLAAGPQRGAQGAAVPAPRRGGDELQGGLLQRAGDEEVVEQPGRAQPGAGRAPGADRCDAQPGGGRLRQRAQVDDVPVGVVGGQRRRWVAVDGEVAGVVVLDQERGGVAHGRGDRDPAVGGEARAVRVRVQRLAVEEPGAGAGERGGELVGSHAVGVGRHRDHPQPGGPGGGQRAEVGRRLDEQRVAGCAERAQRRRERGLPAGADHHVVGAQAGPGLPGEPGPQVLASLGRPALPRRRLAGGAGEGGAERGGRLQVRVQVSAGQRNGPGRR